MGTPPYHFGRRPDPRKAPDGSVEKQFTIKCLCGSTNVALIGAMDEGELKVWLSCKKCGKREEMKVR